MTLKQAFFILRHGSAEGRHKYIEAVKVIEDENNRQKAEIERLKSVIDASCVSCACQLLGERDSARAEVESLKIANEKLYDVNKHQEAEIEDQASLILSLSSIKTTVINDAKADAIKEFAERLKRQVFSDATPHDYEILHLCIDGIAKEFTEVESHGLA